jgi:hypothetical protein
MIHNPFVQQKIEYVSVVNESFKVQSKLYPVLQILIQDMQPVRKFFKNGRLLCYSSNNKTSKKGKYCIFCNDRFQCQNRIRLMLLITNSQKEPLPAILEVNHYSFDSLKRFIKTVDLNSLPQTTVSIKLVYSDNDKKYIEFSTTA